MVAVMEPEPIRVPRRREQWMRASTEITRLLLSNDGEEPLQVIGRRVLQIAGADAVNVVLPAPGGHRLIVEVAAGLGAEQLTGLGYPVKDTVCEVVLETGRALRIADLADEHRLTVHLRDVVLVGPLMVLPLVGTHHVRGALVVGRLRGRRKFTRADLDMAATFANHAAVALELGDARADRERIALLEDRDRIARDLHDHVIQRLFGVGLTINSIATSLGDDARGARLVRIVDDVDETIRQIRTSIFQLRGTLGPSTGQVRVRLLEVAREVTSMLGFAPQLIFAGPVDAVVADEVLDDLIAVLREASTNVARHARARSVVVEVSAALGELTIELTDDGVGMSQAGPRSGLANLLKRAQDRGGTLVVNSPPAHMLEYGRDEGTNLQWTIPLT